MMQHELREDAHLPSRGNRVNHTSPLLRYIVLATVFLGASPVASDIA